MTWYDPFQKRKRKWHERSSTGKKIYLIYYGVILFLIALVVWIDQFSDEAKIRNEYELNLYK